MRYRPEIFALYDDLFKEAQPVVAQAAKAPNAAARAWRSLTGRTRGNKRQIITDLANRNTTDLVQKNKILADARRANKELRTIRQEYVQGGATPGALTAEQQARAAAEQAATQAQQRASGLGRIAGGLGVAGAVGVPAAYLYGRHGAEGERKRTRNLAFGAGAAAGLAAPTVIRGLGNIAQGVGQTGLFPELQGYEGMDPNTFLGSGTPGVGY